MDRSQRMADALITFVGTASAAATIFAAPQIAALLALGHTLLLRGVSARAALEQLTADINVMIDTGRAPSLDEFSALMNRNAIAHDRIQSHGQVQVPTDPPPGNDGTPTEPPPIDGGTIDIDLTTEPATVTEDPAAV